MNLLELSLRLGRGGVVQGLHLIMREGEADGSRKCGRRNGFTLGSPSLCAHCEGLRGHILSKTCLGPDVWLHVLALAPACACACSVRTTGERRSPGQATHVRQNCVATHLDSGADDQEPTVSSNAVMGMQNDANKQCQCLVALGVARPSITQHPLGLSEPPCSLSRASSCLASQEITCRFWCNAAVGECIAVCKQHQAQGGRRKYDEKAHMQPMLKLVMINTGCFDVVFGGIVVLRHCADAETHDMLVTQKIRVGLQAHHTT